MADDRATLIAFFETGDKPTQAQFTALINSLFALNDDNTVEKVIIVAVPVVGDGSGGKILKRGNAVLAMGEFGGDDFAMTSDNGAFAVGGALFINPAEAAFYFDGIAKLTSGTSATVILFNDDAFISCELVGGINRIRYKALDEHLFGPAGGKMGFFGNSAVVRQDITGSRGGNAALASLLTGLESLGLITDSTTA
jgi:hypothetical protein